MRARQLVVSSANQPGGRLELLVAAPDAGPERIADRVPGPARLRGVGQDVGPRGHAPVRPSFLLEVCEGEPERDGCVEFRPLKVLVLRREARLDGHERGHRDDGHQHDGHHHERQHEAEARAPWQHDFPRHIHPRRMKGVATPSRRESLAAPWSGAVADYLPSGGAFRLTPGVFLGPGGRSTMSRIATRPEDPTGSNR